MKLSALATDIARVEGGAWVGDIPGMGAVRLKVRGTGCAAYQAALRRKRRALSRDQCERDGTPKPEAQKRITGEAMAETILLDWDGFTDDDDKPLPFDADLAKGMLVDPKFGAFADAVAWAAMIVADDDAELAKASQGNSQAP